MNELYLSVTFLTIKLYPVAAITANVISNTPEREASKVKFLFKIMISTPENETMLPIIFIMLSFSLKKMNANMGTNIGMVEIITDAVVAETRCKPNVSPKKYKNGSKKASSANNLISFL